MMICGILVSVNTQTSNVRICTEEEEEIPAQQRKKFLRIGEDFLEFYYNGIFFSVNDNIVQNNFIQKNILSGKRMYHWWRFLWKRILQAGANDSRRMDVVMMTDVFNVSSI